MPDRFFLNALEPTNRQLKTPDVGTWKTDDAFLANFSHDIRAKGQLTDLNLVRSVPSVFARPIVFHQALSREDSPLHAAAVAQWRGLLAVFALAQHYRLPIAVKPFSVRTEDETAVRTRAGDRLADRRLQDVLRRQLPKPSDAWARWWLLYCDRELLGATSPWTMVYTATDYRAPACVPWQDKDGVLIDPSAYFAAGPGGGALELGVLLRWLNEVLLLTPWGMEKSFEPQVRTLVRELQAWREELSQHVPARGDLRRDRQVPEPYGHFLSAIIAEGGGAESDLQLRVRATYPITVALPRSLGSGRRLRVHGAVHTDEVDVSSLPSPTGAAGWRTKAGRLVQADYVIPEDAFLPRRLWKLPLASSAEGFGARGVVTPLTPLFFAYFPPEALLGDTTLLTVDERPDAVRVRLNLPLANGGTLPVEREYDGETLIAVPELAAGAAVWPDFMDAGWRENFAELFTSIPRFCAAPLLDDGEVMALTPPPGDTRVLRSWRSDRPPLGFALYDAGGAEPIEAGVLLRRPRVLDRASASARWRIAVDFGTSNTAVAAAGQQGVELQLGGRLLVLAATGSRESISLARNLAADHGVPQPVPTLLARSQAIPMADSPADREVLEWVSCLEPHGVVFSTASDFVGDVKWARVGGAEEGAPQERYLRGLVRSLLCEAFAGGAKEVGLEWSYPLALPEPARKAIGNFWHGLAHSQLVPEGMTVAPSAKGVSESDALCRALAHRDALPARGRALSVAVDIGGGSSDVGFWTQKRLLDSASLRLAANDVLVPAAANAALTTTMFDRCGLSKEYQDVAARIKAAPAVILNALLGSAAGPDGDPSRHPLAVALFGGGLRYGVRPWSTVRSMAYLLTAGLAYYLGLHAQTLREATEMTEVTVYFGGRGSALLAWLTADTTVLREELTKAFVSGYTWPDGGTPPAVELLGPALGTAAAIRLKQEVVEGLLNTPPGWIGSDTSQPPGVLIAERGWSDSGAAIPWQTRVDSAVLRRLRPPLSHGSGTAAFFVETLLKPAAALLALDEDAVNGLTLSSAWLDHRLQAVLDEGDGLLQPLLALELRALLAGVGASLRG